jgi:hypothetical protein
VCALVNLYRPVKDSHDDHSPTDRDKGSQLATYTIQLPHMLGHHQIRIDTDNGTFQVREDGQRGWEDVQALGGLVRFTETGGGSLDERGVRLLDNGSA